MIVQSAQAAFITIAIRRPSLGPSVRVKLADTVEPDVVVSVVEETSVQAPSASQVNKGVEVSLRSNKVPSITMKLNTRGCSNLAGLGHVAAVSLLRAGRPISLNKHLEVQRRSIQDGRVGKTGFRSIHVDRGSKKVDPGKRS
jgi:hypothetical protein